MLKASQISPAQLQASLQALRQGIPKNGQSSNVSEYEVQKRLAGNHRPKNLMMKVGTNFDDVTEADAPNDMRTKVIDLVRNEFVNNYGSMSDGLKYRDLIYSYARQFPDDADISKAVHALYDVNLSENDRLQKLAEENFPGWKPGQRFDKDAMWKLITNSFDMKV